VAVILIRLEVTDHDADGVLYRVNRLLDAGAIQDEIKSGTDCTACDGDGHDANGDECRVCEGEGEIDGYVVTDASAKLLGPMHLLIAQTCRNCGEGRVQLLTTPPEPGEADMLAMTLAPSCGRVYDLTITPDGPAVDFELNQE
jgi:hypothetical protein